MFLVRYFKYSFQFNQMLTRTKEKFWKVMIYFLILSSISLFPMNFLIVQEQGWKLDFIEESFKSSTPTWDLPTGCRIELNRFFCQTNDEYIREHNGITYIFNYQGGGYDLSTKQLIFTHKNIIYTNGNAEMQGTYRGFDQRLSFNDLNLLSGVERSEAFIAFGSNVEKSFSAYIVFYAILVNTITLTGTNLLFILLLSLVLQLFRFGYSTFFSYKESLIFLVYTMGFPAVISFIVGLFAPGVSTVLYQFSIGLIVMVVMLKYGKKEFA
jgi:maltodextrin utilization protein YvdJ